MLQAFLEHLEVKIIIINAIPGVLWKGIVIYLFICDNMTSPKLHVWTEKPFKYTSPQTKASNIFT